MTDPRIPISQANCDKLEQLYITYSRRHPITINDDKYSKQRAGSAKYVVWLIHFLENLHPLNQIPL
jgi:hypothetical protein